MYSFSYAFIPANLWNQEARLGIAGTHRTQFYTPEDITVEELYLTVREQSANLVTNDIKLVYEQQYQHEDEKLLYEVFPCKEARVFFLTLVLSSPI